jgi:alcohol dehydrogenase class IV
MGVVNRYQVSALLEQPEITPAHSKYEKLGRLFSGTEKKSSGWYMEYTVEYIEKLTGQLGLKRLGDFGVKGNELMAIAAITDHKSNPVQFEKEQLVEMMRERL